MGPCPESALEVVEAKFLLYLLVSLLTDPSASMVFRVSFREDEDPQAIGGARRRPDSDEDADRRPDLETTASTGCRQRTGKRHEPLATL